MSLSVRLESGAEEGEGTEAAATAGANCARSEVYKYMNHRLRGGFLFGIALYHTMVDLYYGTNHNQLFESIFIWCSSAL